MAYLFTKAELCRETALSLSTIDRLIRRGKIRVIRIGRAVRIPAAEVRSITNCSCEGEQP